MGTTDRKDPAQILIELKGTQSAPALDALVQRYFAMVYSTCLRITHDRHDAEDAAQAAFLCLARQMRDHKDIRAMGPWLYQVACNTSVDICRRRKRRAAHEPHYAKHESAGVIDDPAVHADLAETRPAVLEALNKLPTRYRLPLILHYFGGMSQEQLAKELACTRNALRVRLHRGHKLLRTSLEKRGICLAGGLLGVILAEAVRSQVSDGLVGSTIALGRQVNGAGFFACAASPDVLAAAAQAAVPAARTKVWIVISLAVASALTASAPLFARLRDLPHLPNPLDLAPFKLPELIAPLLRLSSADPPPAQARSVRVAAAPTMPTTNGRPQPAAAPAVFALWPDLLSPGAASAQAARVAITTICAARSAAPDFVLCRAVAQSQALAESTPLSPVPSQSVVRSALSDHGNGTTQAPVTVAATFQPSTVSPWVPANAMVRGHGSDYIGLAAENDPGGGWLVYLDGSGGAVNALYAAQFTGDPHLLLGQQSVSDAVSHAITTAYTRKPASASTPVQSVQVLRNNGQVIADGRVEDYMWCNSIQNDVDNPRGGFNGWFAMHGGRIELPAIDVRRGTHTYNWGEDASDRTIDLINSMRITAAASGDSELDISLLATDSASLPAFPQGHHFISAYELSGGQTIMGPMHTTVRYDDARLTYLGLNEQFVKLWYWSNPATGWQRAYDNFSRDTLNDWVSADIPSGVQYIGVSTPEPASAMALLGTGALLLLRRSRKS